MGAQTFDFTSTQAAGCAQGALVAGKSGEKSVSSVKSVVNEKVDLFLNKI